MCIRGAVGEQYRALDMGDTVHGCNVVETETDDPLDIVEDQALQETRQPGRVQVTAHHQIRMGETGDHDHQIDIVPVGGGQDSCSRYDGVADTTKDRHDYNYGRALCARP